MNLASHLQTLKTRHATLESRIADEDGRPAPNNGALSQLKVEKLRLKEQMESVISRQSSAIRL